MINFLLICTLGYNYFKLYKKVEKNSKVVGNLKVDDLQEDFWKEN